jgi:beta-glucanase (GH16 family)
VVRSNVALFLLVLSFCEPSLAQEETLVFSDEFEVTASQKPNPEFWDLDTSIKNNEAQCYTDRMENIRIENRLVDGMTSGVLVLEARKESLHCPQDNHKLYQYSSGAINTRKRGRGDFLVSLPHGRYEIKAKIPGGRGTWPAIWLLGDGPLGKWPNSGEIDIMEAVGYEEAEGKYVLYSTLHRNAGFNWPNGMNSTWQGSHINLIEAPSSRFHTWGMEWTPDLIVFSVDDQVVSRFRRSEFAGGLDPLSWPYSLEVEGTQFALILNLAIGGDWGGVQGIDDSIFKDGKKVEMLVDYVRVYKKKGAEAPYSLRFK